MTPIIPPLKSGDRGRAVANLQDVLLLLIEKGLIQPTSEEQRQLPDALRSEQQAAGYGNGTARAVTLFQEKHRLQTTGAVDAPTADAINNFLQELDAIRPDRDALVFTVDGKVVSPNRAGVGGLRVVIVDRNVGEDTGVALAQATTDDDGSYRA